MITKVLFVINIIIRDQIKKRFDFSLADYSSKPRNLKETNIWEFIQQVLRALVD